MTTKNITTGLYIVSTPIGNLKDITFRAVETLSASDIILCEDTRTSRKLMNAHNIKTKMSSLHEYNERNKVDAILRLLGDGKIVSLISDAGTPLISDPGYNLVKSCMENGFYITAIPGACSAITALTLSSFPTNTFFFAGFLPVKSNARIKTLTDLSSIKSTLIFFETAKRLEKSLQDISKVYPTSRVAIAKELTKLFEEVIVDTSENLIEKIHSEDIVLKGEIVLLVSNLQDHQQITLSTNNIQNIDDSIIMKRQSELICKNLSLSPRKIAKIISAELKIPSSEIYKTLTKKSDQ